MSKPLAKLFWKGLAWWYMLSYLVRKNIIKMHITKLLMSFFLKPFFVTKRNPPRKKCWIRPCLSTFRWDKLFKLFLTRITKVWCCLIKSISKKEHIYIVAKNEGWGGISHRLIFHLWWYGLRTFVWNFSLLRQRNFAIWINRFVGVKLQFIGSPEENATK